MRIRLISIAVILFAVVATNARAFESSSTDFEVHAGAVGGISGSGKSASFGGISAGGQTATGISSASNTDLAGILYWLGGPFVPRYRQIHYRWRNDDGSEQTATWAAGEDAQLADVPKNTVERLRFEIANNGWTRGAGQTLRIEYALASDCTAGVYTALATNSSADWQVIDSAYLTDGAPTTNVAGGLTDENAIFVAGRVKDTGNQTASISVTSQNFTEVEFSIKATGLATDGGGYCFRLTNAGAATDYVYASYAKATLAGAVLCGNGIINPGEVCDSANLNGQTCGTRGYTGGTLACYSNCTFNITGCMSGGGGGTNPPPTVIFSSVNLSGRAYPMSNVGVLKDGILAATTIAGPDANFSVTLTGLSAGNYNFSVYGEDKNGVRSSLFTFPTYLSSGVATNISGIFLAPTIAVDKSEVTKGDNIAIFGQSAPASKLSITVNSDQEFLVQADADKDGVYLYNFDTDPLELGSHSTKSKAALNGAISAYGNTVAFIVGTNNVSSGGQKNIMKGDLNGDGKVNLIDFSIAAYWYKRSLSSAFAAIEKARLNGDGKVDLTDFSIMAYYWTG